MGLTQTPESFSFDIVFIVSITALSRMAAESAPGCSSSMYFAHDERAKTRTRDMWRIFILQIYDEIAGRALLHLQIPYPIPVASEGT
jgi:hypothetical protein